MLTAIDRENVPPYGIESRSPIRKFALDTVIEFLERTKVGDVCEVTDFPKLEDSDTVCTAEKVRNAMRTELWHLDKRDHVKMFRRKGRLFMERVKPWREAEPPKRNPYPGDIPKV